MNRLATLMLKARARLRGYHEIAIRGRAFRCDPLNFDFWRRIHDGRWEPETYEIFERRLRPGMVFCDIGSMIGQTVIYAAKIAREAYCFEPDPYAYKFLLHNLHLNGLVNVHPFQVALSAADGWIPMQSPTGVFGQSVTTALPLPGGEGAPSIRALGLSWETWRGLVRPPKIDFFKIDIEGGEFSLLPTLADYFARHKPVVHLSTHAPLLDPPRRAAAMGALRDAMKAYRTCLDEGSRPVAAEALLSEEAATRFRSFLFTD